MGEDVANSPDAAVGPTEASSGSNNGRQRGRLNNSRRGFNRPGTPGATAGDTKTSRFEERCDELKGHVYDCPNPLQAAEEFTKTTKKIAEYTVTEYGTEVKLAIATLQTPILPLPAEPPPEASVTEQPIWERRVDAYVKAEIMLESDLMEAYLLVYGQCSNVQRAKLESVHNQTSIKANANVIGLLKNIKQALASKQLTMTMASGKEMEVSKNFAKNAYLVCALLLGADRNRYGKPIKDLENSFIQGQDR